MLVLINGLQAGNQSGTGTYTTQLARWMPEIAAGREGWDLRIVWPTGLSLPGQSGNPDAFIPRGAAGFVSRLLYDQVGFRRDAARLGADVIHYPASVGGLFPACNMVVTVHDLSFFVDPKWFRFERAQYYRQGVARGVRRASRIIADSRATADDLVKVLRARPDRIDVIPLGVDDRFRPAPGESTE